MAHTVHKNGLYLSVQPILENQPDEWIKHVFRLLPFSVANEAYVTELCASPAPAATVNERMSALLCFLELLQEVIPQALACAELRKDEHGRPYAHLSDPSLPSLDFNLSHSRAFVGCALLVGNGRVGIDVEEIISERLAPRLSARFFSLAEQSYLEAFKDSEEYSLKVTRLWTAKEAISKQDGRGFPIGFDSQSPPPGIVIYHSLIGRDLSAVMTLCAPADAPSPISGYGSLPLQLITSER